MSSDIITNLRLDSVLSSNKVIVVKETNHCDSSFVISCVLGHCIKNKSTVIIVSTHNSLSHYQNVGFKMNYSIQKYIDLGLIQFYNLGEDIMNSIVNNGEYSIDTIFLNVKQKIDVLKENNESVSVIFDGVSHLFDLQYTLREVNKFCNKMITLVRGYSNSFVMFHCNVSNADDVTHVLANTLAHRAYTVLELDHLASGWSADVSGHLTIKHPGLKFENEHMFTFDIKPSHYLFKLFDRGVKLFAPGTV